LALKTNSAVVFLEITNLKRGVYEFNCIPICENPQTETIDITARYLELLEQNIVKQPQSWLWTHKRWKR